MRWFFKTPEYTSFEWLMGCMAAGALGAVVALAIR